jgi:hypothetical protein
VFWILAGGACYYLATRIAWMLCFPDSKVSLFFPPHAVLISILLLVPTGTGGLTRWPPLQLITSPRSRRIGRLSTALHCEVFDAVQNVLAAAGIRIFIGSPFHRITLREAISLS